MPPPQTARAATDRLRVEELEPRYAPAVTIRFDYTYDTGGFFNDPQKRAALQRAADLIGPQLQDDLAAVVPGGGNTWQATFFNPTTNSTVSIPNPTVGEGEVVVYIGAGQIGASELGLTTTGGFSASGSRAWLDTVRARGQAGALATPKTDYSTWGGMITFDSRANWYFGTGSPASNQYDFTSVAQHELMHIFGFGLGEPAFTRFVTDWNGSSGKFTGANVVAAAGGAVGVTGDSGAPDHWAPGTNWHGQPSPMQPALMAGEKRLLTPIDYAALADEGWQVSGVSATPPPPAAPPPPVAPPPAAVPPPPAAPAPVISGPVNSSAVLTALGPVGRLAVGTPAGVDVYGSVGDPLGTVNPFADGSPGGERVVTADVTGDGTPDLIVGTGPGRSALVAVLDGQTHAVVATFTPFEPAFTGGVFVAAGDLTGDGRPEVVVTPDQTGGPVVAVYDGASIAAGSPQEITQFLGVADPDFRGGCRAAVGDVNGDGTPDLIVSAGFGGGPRVAIFDGTTVHPGAEPARLVADFFAFEPTLRNGAYVAAADLNGDGKAEVVVGAGPGGGPRVQAFDGAQLLAGERVALTNFFAGDPASRSGVRVAALDLDGDGRPDVVTGAGSGGEVNVYAARDLARGATPPAWLTLTAPGNPADGVYVG